MNTTQTESANKYLKPIAQIKNEPRIKPKTWLREVNHFHNMRKPPDLDDIALERVPAKRPVTSTLKYPDMMYSDLPGEYQHSIETINGEPPSKQLYVVHTSDRGETRAIIVDKRQYSLAAAIYTDGPITSYSTWSISLYKRPTTNPKSPNHRDDTTLLVYRHDAVERRGP